MRAFALRNKQTGMYLPWGDKNRSNSRAAFNSIDRPRLFNSLRSVTFARVAWRAGKWHYPLYDPSVPFSKPGPKSCGREDIPIEIVEFQLIEVIK
jgi:hypothetical protein